MIEGTDVSFPYDEEYDEKGLINGRNEYEIERDTDDNDSSSGDRTSNSKAGDRWISIDTIESI